MLRRPCVAGHFYPGSAKELDREITGFLSTGTEEKTRAVAIVTPHAGYMYSGHVAGAVFARVQVPDDVIVIGPNHTGLGPNVSVMTEGLWEMPFGKMEINPELARMLVDSSPLFTEDTEAHIGEHSLEVQLPFIHRLNPAARFVPVTVMRADKKACRELGEAIAGVIREYGKEVLLVVSSDMNHYENDKLTREKDDLALERVLTLDADNLIKVTCDKEITMCGVLPAAIAINAAKSLGATEARLVKHATSGDVSGDYDHVVGYAGVIIK